MNYRAEFRGLRETAGALVKKIGASDAPLEVRIHQACELAQATLLITRIERRLYGIDPQPMERKTLNLDIALLAEMLEGISA